MRKNVCRNEDIMTIKEVSQKYNISQDTLRYYERVGLIPTVARTSGGIRNYTENDLGWVENAICMRNAGVPIEALIEYVKLYQQECSYHSSSSLFPCKRWTDEGKPYSHS